MRRSISLLLLVAGCHSAGSRLPPTSPPLLSLRIVGDTNPDSMPPSCRVHGGTRPVRSALPVWAPARRLDRRLDSLAAGEVAVHLSSATTGRPFKSAAVSLEPGPPGSVIMRYPTSDGWSRLRAPAGRYLMRIRSIDGAFLALLDSFPIRRGYADTLILVVGHPWLCGL